MKASDLLEDGGTSGISGPPRLVQCGLVVWKPVANCADESLAALGGCAHWLPISVAGALRDMGDVHAAAAAYRDAGARLPLAPRSEEAKF